MAKVYFVELFFIQKCSFIRIFSNQIYFKNNMNNSDDPPLSGGQEYHAFLSFDLEDKSFAQALYDALQKKINIEVWFSAIKFREGRPILVNYEINKGIKQSKYCLAIFSANSIGSWWFFKELGAFDVKEKMGQKLIIPILYKIDFDYFAEHFPLYAGGFAITDYEDIEGVAEQILIYLGIEMGQRQVPLSNEQIPRHSKHEVKYTDSLFYPSRENSLDDAKIDELRCKICLFYPSDPHYFIRINMNDFFSTSEEV